MLNRHALFAALDAGIAGAHAVPERLGLLLLRTQRRRELDAVFGYEATEKAADAMHAAIAAALRPVDRIIQVGEGDYAVLLPGLASRNHAALAAAKLVRVMEQPFQIDGTAMLLPIAVGGAVYPDDGATGEELCRRADMACSDAASGSERHALYTAPAAAHAFPHGDLRDAVAGNRLELFFQPIASLRDPGCRRVEALSRWSHRELGAIPPDAFIRVAEQTGLIGELTRWNFNAALRHVAQAHADGHAVRLSVNLSVAVLQQASFPEQVLDMLHLWDVPADAVVLEVTESGLMNDLTHSERMLRQLRGHGFGIAIDDFGTGYSSMAYLKRLPATELKIDKSFVLDMARDRRVCKLVESMIDLSHHLAVEVVAEGVEDAGTLDMLRNMGCDHAQGYHLGRPLPALEALAALAPLDARLRTGQPA